MQLGYYAPIKETFQSDDLECIYEYEYAELVKKSGSTLVREAIEEVKIRIHDS
jgi:hypothetical protein